MLQILIPALDFSEGLAIKKSEGLYKDTKLIKKNINKKSLNIPFETFWNMYDYKKAKGGPRGAEAKWKNLSDKDRQACINALPKWLENWEKENPDKDKKFRPYPNTFLNQRRWEDEIPEVDRRETPKTRSLRYRLNSHTWINTRGRLSYEQRIRSQGV